MSALGQKRTSRLFDYFIRTRVQGWWNFDFEIASSAQVQDQFERGWIENGQVSWLSALENAAAVYAGLPV